MNSDAYRRDTAIRNDPSLTGREAYEASRIALPNYEDGAPRPAWERLDAIAQWSWERPTKREAADA